MLIKRVFTLPLPVCLSVCLSVYLSIIVFNLDLLKKMFQVAQGPRITCATDKSVCVHVDCISNRFLIRTLWARTAFCIVLIVRFACCAAITAVGCFPSVLDSPPNTSIITLICLTISLGCRL